MPFPEQTKYLQTMAEDGITFSDRDRDAVEKLRVSNPQSLIDTDFEYSLQNTKWEFLTLCNNYPGVYARSNEPAYTSEQITSILPSGIGNRSVTVTVNTLPRSPFKIGDSVVLKETANTTYVDGAYVITAVFSEYSFQVVTKSPTALVGDQKTQYTALYTGGFYTNANIPINGVSAIAGTSAALIEFTHPHNLYIGTPIIVVNNSLSAVPWCGSFEVSAVPSSTRVIYQTLTGSNYPSSTLLVPASGAVYARTEGVAVHRFFDGGVQINPGTSAPNARIMRQTRKYFKYQSGKSMQFSTGVLFRPVYEVTNAYINKTKFNEDAWIYQFSLSSVNYLTATGTYFRTASGDVTFNGPNNNYISYNEYDTDTWALYSPEENDYLAYTVETGYNALTGAWNNRFGDITTLTNFKYKNLVYPYYDFEISTEQYHGFAQPDDYKDGCTIRTTGFDTAGIPNDPYNNTFKIANVINSKTFQVQIPVDEEFNPFPNVSLTPGGLGYVEVLGWNDATVRTGLFDDQNGLFFEFDGKEFWVVKRQTTTPINGTVTVKKGSPWVVSTDGFTKFTSQLNVNNFVNIQGMSYQIGTIYNDLSATITPTYRGPDAAGLKVIRTEELRIPQSEFNLDKLDGTGPSSYKLNLNRMQMMFIDYSWYGAGKVRYGIRAVNGKIIYFHEIYNNNVNIKAHMRSGNLPGRFEITSTSKTGTMITSLSTNTLSGAISKADADILPTVGKIVINNEYIEYTKGIDLSNNRVQLIFDNRNVGGLTSGPLIHPSNSTFVSYNQNCSPALSHWGVAALMDGDFNEDKSYLFTGSNQTSLTAMSADQALLSIRLAPSVDYGIIGKLGERNLVNHSTLKPQTIGIVTNNPLQINVKVNCEPQTLFKNLSAWRFVANGSIAQYYDHSLDGSFEVEGTGGDLIASFFVAPEAILNSGQYSCKDFNIEVVRELTNSILGGDFPYPDGPDVVTISVKTLDGGLNYNAVCRARMSWTEDQG